MAHIIYSYKGKVINMSALAEKLKDLGIPGSSLGNLSRVFSGRHRPRLDLALAIAKIMHIPLDEIEVMLAHCKQQRADWSYVPTWGKLRSPRAAQEKGTLRIKGKHHIHNPLPLGADRRKTSDDEDEGEGGPCFSHYKRQQVC